MSYILDALRRAEAERSRGAVPGLHSQAVPVSGQGPATTRPVALLWWMGGVVALVAMVAASGAWWMMQRGTAPGGPAVSAASLGAPAPSVATAPSPPMPPVSVAPLAQAQPAAPSTAPVVAALVSPAPPVAPASPVKRATPPPRAKATQVPDTAATPPLSVSRPRSTAAVRAPQPAPVATDAAAVTASRAATAPATGTVFAMADLPDAVRAQLPALKISGITYSRNAVSRMAIVNGQVLHEGNPAAPGLLLERIEPGRTVWSFQGYRYGLTP